MKKITVLENNGGRMANQLWHFASMYAYCLEKGYECENLAFFRYVCYFNFSIKNVIVNSVFVKFYKWHKNIKLTKVLYIIYIRLIKMLFSRRIIVDNNEEFLLPPTPNLKEEQMAKLRLIDRGKNLNWFFCGWLFRNPVGLEKYRREICEYFKPREQYYNLVLNFIKKLKSDYKLVVGIHIRQGDYKTWEGGQYYFTSEEVRKIIDDFLLHKPNIKIEDTVFVICSDGKINDGCFRGLNTVLGPGTEITDLYTLTASDLIIGSTSTYGSWAAYYGNIPFIKFSKDKIDWSIVNI